MQRHQRPLPEIAPETVLAAAERGRLQGQPERTTGPRRDKFLLAPQSAIWLQRCHQSSSLKVVVAIDTITDAPIVGSNV